MSRCTLLAVFLLAAGCGLKHNVTGRDDGVFIPAFRAQWRLEDLAPREGGAGERDAGAATSEREDCAKDFSWSDRIVEHFEVEVAYASGEDRQQIPSGRSVRVRGQRFAGPDALDLRWDLAAGSISYRGGYRVAPWLVAQGLAGLGVTSLYFEGDSVVGGRGRQPAMTLGPILGAQISYDPFDFGGAYARWTTTFGSVPDRSRLDATEVGASLRLYRETRLFAAWRWWDYVQDGHGSADLDLKLSGPSVGFELRF